MYLTKLMFCKHFDFVFKFSSIWLYLLCPWSHKIFVLIKYFDRAIMLIENIKRSF